MKLTINLLLLSALTSAAFAGGFTVCSTGFAGSTSGCGSAVTSPASNALIADGNWYVSNQSGATNLGSAFVTINGSYPVAPGAGNPWLTNDASSSWVTPTNNQAGLIANGTQFYYSSSFNVVAGQQGGAFVSGAWLADDFGTGVYLNGVNTNQASLPVFGGLGGPMVLFSVANGGGVSFSGGANILTFGVMNDGRPNTVGPNPSGFRVNITGQNTGVPEPSTVLLLSAGLAGMGYLARRRRQA